MILDRGYREPPKVHKTGVAYIKQGIALMQSSTAFPQFGCAECEFAGSGLWDRKACD